MRQWWRGAGIAAAAACFGVSSAWGAGSSVLKGLSSSSSYAVAGNVNPGSRMTLEAWVKPTSWRSYSGREKHGLNFLYKGLIGSRIDYVFSLQEDGIPCLGNTYGYYGVLNKRVPLNQWTHLAVTLDNSTGDMRFYINGEYAGAGSGWQGFSGSKKGFLSASGYDLTIGGFYQRGWNYNNDNFIGELADVRIWSVVRSAADIKAWMDRELTGKESGLIGYWTFADKKDRSGQGHHLKFEGSAKVSAGRGPTLWGNGVSVQVKDPADGVTVPTGASFRLRAEGVDEDGKVGAVTFYVNGEAIKGVLDKTGPDWKAHADWTPKKPGWYGVQAEAVDYVKTAKGSSGRSYVGARGPWNGSAALLPGKVEAEHFDIGGEGVSWHDTTAGHLDKAYRNREGVDISTGGSGYAVSSTKAGEWVAYSVDGGAGGTWVLAARCGARGAGGRFRVLMDGKDATGDVTVPDTGSWTNFAVVRAKITVPKGAKKMRVEMRANGASGCVGNFDWFQVETARLELGASARTLGAAVQRGKEFQVKANHAWSAASGAKWLRIRSGAGTCDGTVVYDVDANSGAARTGTITVTGIGVSRSYTVTQSGVAGTSTTTATTVTPAPATTSSLSLGTSSRTLGAAAQDGQSLAVRGNVSWTAKSDASWLKITKGASGKGNGTVTYAVQKNTGMERQGRIVVSGGGMTRTFSVTQQGTVAAWLQLGTSSRTLGTAAQGGKELEVRGNVSWTAKSDASWLKITKGASGKGNGTVCYGVAANNGTRRTGHITVTGGGKSATFTVTQQGVLGLGSTSRSFGTAAASGKELLVGGCVSWTAKSDASWLFIQRGKSGTGNGTVCYGVTANSGTRRTGHIMVTGGGVTVTFTVTQRGVLGLGSTSRSFGTAAASGKELSVGGCVSWTAKSDASWLKITKGASGQGDGKVYYSVAANTGGARTGHISVTGGGVTVRFTVTQSGAAVAKAMSKSLQGTAATSGAATATTTATKTAKAAKKANPDSPRAVPGTKEWRRFVATGTVEDTGEEFTAKIEAGEDGNMRVTWTPDLGTSRVYRVWGKRSLMQGEWETPVTAEHRYFRVEVRLPEEEEGGEE